MVRGGARLHEVLNLRGEPYRNKQEVAELAWFLLYKATVKGAAFCSGAWLVRVLLRLPRLLLRTCSSFLPTFPHACVHASRARPALQIQDTDYLLFEALSPLCYTRKLYGSSWNAKGDTNYTKASFGSTHLVEFVMHCAKRGGWHVPEDKCTQRLERGGKALGYYPIGCDIDTDPAHQDGSIERGLFCNKGHVVFGKVPPKPGMKEGARQWLFVKCEQFGNQQVTDTIGHTANLGKTIAGVKKHAHGGAKRQEKIKKRDRQSIEGHGQKKLVTMNSFKQADEQAKRKAPEKGKGKA